MWKSQYRELVSPLFSTVSEELSSVETDNDFADVLQIEAVSEELNSASKVGASCDW